MCCWIGPLVTAVRSNRPGLSSLTPCSYIVVHATYMVSMYSTLLYVSTGHDRREFKEPYVRCVTARLRFSPVPAITVVGLVNYILFHNPAITIIGLPTYSTTPAKATWPPDLHEKKALWIPTYSTSTLRLARSRDRSRQELGLWPRCFMCGNPMEPWITPPA